MTFFILLFRRWRTDINLIGFGNTGGFITGIAMMGAVAIWTGGPAAGAEVWPAPAVRSGTTLPQGRDIAGRLNIGGIYTRHPGGYAERKAGLMGGDFVWSFGLISGLGLFGQHMLNGLVLDDVTTLMFGHEVGLRYLLFDFLAFEAAYLGHRFEYELIDGHAWAVGGLYDHGGEVAVWGHGAPMQRLRLGGRLFGRYFGEPGSGSGHHYADGQWVIGMGGRVSILIIGHHAIDLYLETLRVRRLYYAERGVEKRTWNTSAEIYWRWSVTAALGVEAGCRLSSDMFAGIMPVFEVKRSLMNQPIGTARVGFFFTL